MVDKVLSCNLSEAITQLIVCEDNIFLDDNRLSPAGMLENMAQSCAARMGCVNRMHNEAIKIGFIGDIRDFTILRQPLCHDILRTRVQIIEEVFNLTLAFVTIYLGEEPIATARMKIALTDMEASGYE